MLRVEERVEPLEEDHAVDEVEARARDLADVAEDEVREVLGAAEGGVEL